MCERCGDERCSDPDSKWCSDILLMRYKAENDALRADIERYVQRDTERVREMEGMRADAERLRANTWTCPECSQTNASWANTCGRCDAARKEKP